MKAKLQTDVPSLIDLKRDEILWEGKQYELSFLQDPKLDNLKKYVEEKFSHVKEQISELYPMQEIWFPINEWFIEQANLLAVAFWNDVHEKEEDYLWESVINHTNYYVYESTIEDRTKPPYQKYPTGGFSIYQKEPWADDKRARLICETKGAPVINPKQLYTTSKEYGYESIAYTDFQKEYTWRFAAHLYRALRRNNILYKDTFKVISDRLTFRLELL